MAFDGPCVVKADDATVLRTVIITNNGQCVVCNVVLAAAAAQGVVSQLAGTGTDHP